MFNLEHWLCLCEIAQSKITRPSYLYYKICTHYREPHRRYHNLAHIGEMLANAIDCRRSATNWVALELAIVFHDVIYDPRHEDNERQSTQFAKTHLEELGIEDTLIIETATLIMATAHEQTSNDVDAQLITDLDLLGFSKSYEEFIAQGERIRQEFSHVPEKQFRAGQIKILQGFLDRPRIYSSPMFEGREAVARANLTRAINNLQAVPAP